jgi:hypothetical protein
MVSCTVPCTSTRAPGAAGLSLGVFDSDARNDHPLALQLLGEFIAGLLPPTAAAAEGGGSTPGTTHSPEAVACARIARVVVAGERGSAQATAPPCLLGRARNVFGCHVYAQVAFWARCAP